METTQTVEILGRFIVADPKVCYGQPTFRGIRVFIADILDIVKLKKGYANFGARTRLCSSSSTGRIHSSVFCGPASYWPTPR
jgi:hypothetical protein